MATETKRIKNTLRPYTPVALSMVATKSYPFKVVLIVVILAANDVDHREKAELTEWVLPPRRFSPCLCGHSWLAFGQGTVRHSEPNDLSKSAAIA